MDSQLPTPDPAPAAGELLPCFGCGYDLRATDRQSVCPECGMPVTDTLARGLVYEPLANADPVWAQNTARVYQLLPIYLIVDLGLWIAMAIACGFAGVLISMKQSGSSSSLATVPSQIVVVLQGMALVFMLLRVSVLGLGLYLLWHLSAADLKRQRVPIWDNWRAATRVVFYLFAVVLLFEVIGWLALAAFLPWIKVDDLGGAMSLLSLIGTVQSYLWLVGGYTAVQGAVELAGRLGSDPLKTETVNIKAFFNVYAILMLVSLAFCMSCCLYCLSCFTMPVALVLWIVYIVMAAMTYPKLAAAIRDHLAKRGPAPSQLII